MQSFKFVSLFTKNNLLQLRRKWRTLPLLLLFPFILIGLIAYILVSYTTSLEEEPLQIGLVDLDQSKETEMVINLLEESSQLGDFIHMTQLSQEEARDKMAKDDLLAYILFPNEFTNKLYDGESVVVTVVGHPEHPMESYFVKELIDSAARHISSSQANILTINYYAKQLDLETKLRNQIVQQQFNEFLLYAIGKDNVLDQNVLTNNATTSPKEYFTLAASFFILTVWGFMLYLLLFKEQSNDIQIRMKLYGVTELQQVLARIIVTSLSIFILSLLLFIGLIHILNLDMQQGNYGRLMLLIGLYISIYLLVLAIIETLFQSPKIRLLIQVILTGILLLSSGSLIPDMYLPIYVQEYLPLIFSNHTFSWLEEILLNKRMYVDLVPMLLSLGIALFGIIGITSIKERVKS
ncbi:ABC transporter permease [Ornithinibacillus scapharcae]|uniref:ABC transporter permease n=1 Tax=Ornithinibacillus scapharcae TaxID=1147159 RepID=UPI000225C04C|nr:ABC transporter permease [Ornithinibacillus scapharcae]